MHRTLTWLSAVHAVESHKEASSASQSQLGALTSSSAQTFSWSSYLPSSSCCSLHVASATSLTCLSFLDHLPSRFSHGTFQLHLHPSDRGPNGLHPLIPSAHWFRDMYDKFIKSHMPEFDQYTSQLSSRGCAIDHSFKVLFLSHGLPVIIVDR